LNTSSSLGVVGEAQVQPEVVLVEQAQADTAHRFPANQAVAAHLLSRP
jgi:hypothetical protein